MKKLDDFIIRGSSAGMIRHEEFLGDSETNCPRKTILRHLKIEETHSKTTLEIFSLGHYFEAYFQTIHPEFQYEVEINVPGLQGHADAVCPNYVWELKSVTSKNTKRSVFGKNTPKSANVLQLAVYMLALERQHGKLCYGDFTHISTYDKLVKMNPSEIGPLFVGAVPLIKEFDVAFTDDGFLTVDGASFYNIHAQEILDFQNDLHELVRTRTLPPMIQPLDPTAWSNPCRFCKLSALCESNPTDLEDFCEVAAEVYEQS